MQVLALEGSTSAAKAMLWDGVCSRVQASNYPANIADGVSIDPAGALDLLLDCAARLVEATGAKPDVLSLGSVWHGLLPVDRDVAPIGRYRTWADTAMAGALDRRRGDAPLLDDIYRRTGCPPHSSFTFWKLMDLRDAGALPHGAITLGEYFFYSLTGARYQSATSAAGTGLWNLSTRSWDPEQLARCGVDEAGLFALREPGFTAPLSGGMAGRLGIAEGTPVTVSMPDGALNQIAAGGMRDGILTLSVGTSAALRIGSAAPLLSLNRETWCYYGAEGRFICGGAISGAGNLVGDFLAEEAEDTSLAMLECELEAGDFHSAPCFLPFKYGERSPGWKDRRGYGYRDLRSDHGRTARFYAVLEGVLMNLYQAHEALRSLVGDIPLRGDLSGGIQGSRFWTQLCADLFGQQFCLNPDLQASLMGAAHVGAYALGEIRSLCDIAPAEGVWIKPDMERHEQLMVRYARYLEHYT